MLGVVSELDSEALPFLQSKNGETDLGGRLHQNGGSFQPEAVVGVPWPLGDADDREAAMGAIGRPAHNGG